jgi:hypothetical protein
VYSRSADEDMDRDERRQRMKEFAKKHRMEDFGDEFIKEDRMKRHRDRHEQYMNDAMRQDGRHDDGRDIHDRHKDLLTHREQDFKKRLDKAQFTAEEEEVMMRRFDEYLAIEREVMDSR